MVFGHTHDWKSVLGMKATGDRQRAFATDSDDALKLERPCRLEHARNAVLAKAVVAGRAEDRPSPGEDSGNGMAIEGDRLSGRQPAKTMTDTDHLVASRDRTAGNRADRRIQAGAVASAGEDSNGAHDQYRNMGLPRT